MAAIPKSEVDTMERVDPQRESPPDASREAPNEGAIVTVVDDRVVVLSEARHWVEDDEHVIASTEFQVSASASTFRDAFRQVTDNLLEEAEALFDLIEAGRAAPNEEEEASRLGHRLARAMELEEEASRREAAKARALYRRLLRGGTATGPVRRWQTRPAKQRTSGEPLRA